MDNKVKTRMLIGTLICLIPIIFGIIVYNKLPDQVAIHFDSYGEPNGYLPRAAATFVMPLFLAVINVVVNIRAGSDFKKNNRSPFMNAFSIWLVPAIALIVQSYILLYALDNSINSGRSVIVGAGIMLILVGNYLPKCRQNNTIGIKLPWTLEDADNWNKTHRLAGIIWVIGGIILVIIGLLHISGTSIIIIALAVIFTPCIYSFILHIRSKS